MTTPRPWLAWYPADIMTDRKYLLLPRTARATYRELLDRCWMDGCQVENDPQELAGLLGMTVEDFMEDWGHIQNPKRPCFKPHPDVKGKLTNTRMLAEWRKAGDFAEQMRANGRKGGRPPKAKDPGIPTEKTSLVSTGNQTLLREQNQIESSSQSQSQSQEEKDIKQYEPAPPVRTVRAPKPDYSTDFEELWKALPPESRHNVSKKLAAEKYAKARGKAGREEILAGAQAMVQQWANRPPGAFVPRPPMATTWLHQERWTADYSLPEPDRGRGQAAKVDPFDEFEARMRAKGGTDGTA